MRISPLRLNANWHSVMTDSRICSCNFVNSLRFGKKNHTVRSSLYQERQIVPPAFLGQYLIGIHELRTSANDSCKSPSYVLSATFLARLWNYAHGDCHSRVSIQLILKWITSFARWRNDVAFDCISLFIMDTAKSISNHQWDCSSSTLS